MGFLPIAFKMFEKPDAKEYFSKVLTYFTLILIFAALGLSIFSDELLILLAKNNIEYQLGAKYILRGLRTAADFEYERAIAQVNKAMHEGIETVFLLTMPEHTPINSSIVRDILRHGGDVSKFIPEKVKINKIK